MDSRIMEALKVVSDYVNAGEANRPASNYFASTSLKLIESHLLTAEPEPCEDAREIAMKVLAIFSEAACPGYHFFATPEIQPGLEEAAAFISRIIADASQVADKRVEELRDAKVKTDDVGTVREYLKTTREWYEQGHAELGDEMSGIESEGDYAEAAFERLIEASQASSRLSYELEHGGFWMKRAKAFMENGGCPVCFSTDEDGHTPGCEYGKADKEVKELMALVEMLRDALIECRSAAAIIDRCKIIDEALVATESKQTKKDEKV